jgi:(p)ppGpp synthase/HD superfamily hydrolase
LTRAAQFAAERHAAQRRKDAASTPYVNHLIEVTALLAEVVGDSDPNLLAAAMLHDAIEDVDVTREEIAELFGEDVAELVMLVTDDRSLPKPERKRLQVCNAPRKPRRAQWLKIADKISNIRAVRDNPPEDWSIDRRREYVTWARQVVGGFTEPHPLLMERFTAIEADLLRQLE